MAYLLDLKSRRTTYFLTSVLTGDLLKPRTITHNNDIMVMDTLFHENQEQSKTPMHSKSLSSSHESIQ